jgi:DNA-binding NtrC family response regulator
VRELENTLERALLICNNKYLTEEDLGAVLDEKEETIQSIQEIVVKDKTGQVDDNDVQPQTKSQIIPQETMRIATLKEIEMDAIKASVERNKWNMTTTAEELGISRMTLYRKLELYGLRSKN